MLSRLIKAEGFESSWCDAFYNVNVIKELNSFNVKFHLLVINQASFVLFTWTCEVHFLHESTNRKWYVKLSVFLTCFSFPFKNTVINLTYIFRKHIWQAQGPLNYWEVSKVPTHFSAVQTCTSEAFPWSIAAVLYDALSK